jgi:hypothetical protein
MMASNVYGKSPIQTILYCLVCCGLLAGVVLGQPGRQQPAIGRTFDKTEVADAVAKVKSGKFNGYHVGLIGEAGAIEAIPDLEKQFARAAEPLDKAKIAQVLLLLGDKKDAYWNFLAELAKPALESDAPNPIQYDPQGKSMPGLSPEFIAWAEAHSQSPNEAGENAIYTYPGIVMLVGGTRDPRAIPLLRQALSSPNHLIENAAAKGLAEVQDAASVPLIIGACKKAPAEAASAIAESLVYFDDPQAQNAVDTYVPKEEAKVLREARMMGRGALHR